MITDVDRANKCAAAIFIQAIRRIEELDPNDNTVFEMAMGVADLVKRYKHLPVAVCIGCGDWSPLRLGYCAWGCDEY